MEYTTCPYFLYICIMEESLEKSVYKILLYLLKIIPMLLALTALLNTTFSYFGIDAPILSYIGGVSLLPLIFLYIASYAFRFCEYHRMFLHYVLVTWILNIVDYYYGIPVSDKHLFLLYLIVTCVFLFLILYMYVRSRKARY